MNIVFSVIIIVSTVLLLLIDPSLVLPALTDSSIKAVELSLKLLSIYAVWMGILWICDASGVSKKLSHALRPVIRFLFGNVSETTMEALSVNMSANILGMGNAATPAAMNAIKSMDEGRRVANYAMIMLVVLNATSLQVLPTSIISLRQSFGSASPSDIILPSFIASTIATVFGVAMVMVIYRRGKAKIEERAERHSKRRRAKRAAVIATVNETAGEMLAKPVAATPVSPMKYLHRTPSQTISSMSDVTAPPPAVKKPVKIICKGTSK